MNFQELKAIGLANPKGKMVSKDATGKDINNIGAWNGSDCDRYILLDLIRAAQRLSSIPSHLIGNVESFSGILTKYEPALFQNWFELLPLFKDGGNLWEGPKFMHFDPTADPGIVLLVGFAGDVVYIDTR